MIVMIILYALMIVIYLVACRYDINKFKCIQRETMFFGLITILIGIGLICMNLMIR